MGITTSHVNELVSHGDKQEVNTGRMSIGRSINIMRVVYWRFKGFSKSQKIKKMTFGFSI